MFYTQYVRPEKAPFLEKVDSTRITEQAGYIKPKDQIEQFLLAGKRLAQYRKELFDFQPGENVDTSFSDPTRAPGFDLAEASELAFMTARVMNGKRVEKKEEEKPVQEQKNP